MDPTEFDLSYRDIAIINQWYFDSQEVYFVCSANSLVQIFDRIIPVEAYLTVISFLIKSQEAYIE